MWPTDELSELTSYVTPERFPLVSALLVSEDAKTVFINFALFCRADFVSVAKALEGLLEEKRAGVRKTVRPGADYFGITPIKGMAFYSQAPAARFQALFIGARKWGICSKQGLFWEW